MALGSESGRNGLAPVLHHVHSQLYFLGLRAKFHAVCEPRGAPVSIDANCNPRLDFVGKLEELESHLPAMLERFGFGEPGSAIAGAIAGASAPLVAGGSANSLGNRSFPGPSAAARAPLRALFDAWQRGDPAVRDGAKRDSQANRCVT